MLYIELCDGEVVRLNNYLQHCLDIEDEISDIRRSILDETKEEIESWGEIIEDNDDKKTIISSDGLRVEFSRCHDFGKYETACDRCSYGEDICECIPNPSFIITEEKHFMGFCNNYNYLDSAERNLEKYCLVPAPGSLEKTFQDYPEVLKILKEKE